MEIIKLHFYKCRYKAGLFKIKKGTQKSSPLVGKVNSFYSKIKRLNHIGID